MPEALEGEYSALRGRAARVEVESDWLRVAGSDRLRFSNGLVTCDLKNLGAGEGAYGFFTDPKGRVLTDAAFLETGADLWVELPSQKGAEIARHMAGYVVADQVDVTVLDGWRSLRVAGPRLEVELPPALGVASPSSAWGGQLFELEGERWLIRDERRLGVPGVVLAGDVNSVKVAENKLAEAGFETVGAQAVEAVRIEEGVSWFGSEFGLPTMAAAFPQETGLEDWAVSYEKGCYLGQEVVARIHFRGKVNRSLRGLLFEPESLPTLGMELTSGGETVGVVGIVAESVRLGRPIGLAIVHHKAKPGGELVTAGGRCRLVELPFLPPADAGA